MTWTLLEHERQQQLFQLVYFKVVTLGLKGDIVAGVFVVGWVTALVAVEIASFQFGTLTASFYSLLPRRDWMALKMLCAKFAYFTFFMAMAKAVSVGVRGLLARSLRRNLTCRLHALYCTPQNIHSSVPQVDQRICEDVERAYQGSLKLAEVFLMAPILVYWYTARLSSGLMSAWGIGTIYAHFFLFWLLLRPALSLLRSQIKRKEAREAVLRGEHVNIVQNGKEFAALPGQALNALRVNMNFALNRALFTAKQLIITESAVEAMKSISAYSGSLLAFVLMAAEASVGQWKEVTDAAGLAEKISITAYVTLYLIFQLGRLTGIVDELGIVNGQLERLQDVISALEPPNDPKSACSRNCDPEPRNLSSSQDKVLKSAVVETFEGAVDCRLLSPTGLVLAETISFPLETGKHVLICGPNGAGKTALLTGLHDNQLPVRWSRPPLTCMLCPQTPILFTGSVLDLLGVSTTLAADATAEDTLPVNDAEKGLLTGLNGLERIRQALAAAGLTDCRFELERVYSVAEWKQLLTPGQVNRLALARVLLHKPQLALLDETLLSLNADELHSLFALFAEQGTTVIATSHEPSTNLQPLFSVIKRISNQ